jgi:small subunit ribosomal protein S21
MSALLETPEIPAGGYTPVRSLGLQGHISEVMPHGWDELTPALCSVRVAPGEHIDGALRRFKKADYKNGVLKDLDRHESYTPPSARRRQKSAAARKRREP